MDYSSTINLPKTAFPMKAGLKEKEPKIIKKWEEEKLYQQLRELRKGAPKCILHDGPPYANGDIHIGTSLNKIIKDIIVRYKSAKGFDSPYVPGWDCHGMPIELKVQESLGDKYKETSKFIMRKKCRAYAQKYIDIQRKEFKRLGVMGDWENPYLTMSPEYESEIVEVFAQLVEKGYIYKGLRTIHWCMDCETALAAAEIEYDDNHTSTSVYVRFPVLNKINDKLDGNVDVMIWTTTPWTLPSNMACAFNRDLEYVAVEIDGRYAIMTTSLVDTVLSKKDMKAEGRDMIPVSMEEIEKLEIAHPFIKDRKSAVVFADYVEATSGTGIVHTAPGHGMEDYQTGMNYGLEIYCPVDKAGRYTSDFPEMQGMKVRDANPKVVEILENNGSLYHKEKVTHSYPICWRCKNPLIFRATSQWFMDMTHDDIDKRTVKALDNIKWYPTWGHERMQKMLENRPDWCLSRQRSWGVPIPAFYCKNCGKTLLTAESTRHFAEIVKTKGMDVWFELEAKDLLPEGTKCECGSTDFDKEQDILDVWFDSGVSSFAAQKTNKDLDGVFPVDIYLEGGDQYRGWFQAAIWPSMAIRGIPPYKELVTHGWTLDEQGRAMHKSAGNVVSPLEVIDKYGADILRLWCISEDFTHNARVGDNMMKAIADNYRKIRNTFRYLLGNISDFDFTKEKIEVKDLLPVDRYALSRLHSFIKVAEKACDGYEFHLFYQRLINYCVVELSATYFDIIKDRLYCDRKDSVSRRSAQTVLVEILDVLVKIIAPVLPFTTDEVWGYYKGENASSVHLELYPKADDNLIDLDLEKEWASILKVRDDVLLSLERARDNSTIGKSLEAYVTICTKEPATKELLTKYEKYLNEIFIVSKVTLSDSKDDTFIDGGVSFVKTEKASHEKCVRCWGHYDSVGTDSEHKELCTRCAEAVR
ncbi:isoleucine--tRNA ligase [Brachyspira pulli]|uniref:isoleucine--tRNA ligase n=1 Tax=Brachyspira pulli TaxID=310721 RepID=UPI0030060EB9